MNGCRNCGEIAVQFNDESYGSCMYCGASVKVADGKMSYDRLYSGAISDALSRLDHELFDPYADPRDPRNRPDVKGPVIEGGMTEGREDPTITCCEYHRRGGLWLFCNNER